MTDVKTGGRSLDDGQLEMLVAAPCATLAALMTVQLPPSPELADGLAKLDEARKLFRLAAAMQTCPPTGGT